jgi:hypothetical protein
MATRNDRLSKFTTEGDPPSGTPLKLLCEDHIGTYVLRFPCIQVGGCLRNAASGEAIVPDVVGWALWPAQEHRDLSE